MGLIQSLTDDVQFTRHVLEFGKCIEEINQMPDSRASFIFRRFACERLTIQAAMQNWSRDGCLKVAGSLRSMARKEMDFNRPEGLALWLVSAWLESGQRGGEKARKLYGHLQTLGEQWSAQALGKHD